MASNNTSRSFNSIPNCTVTDQRVKNDALNTAFGGGGNVWGSSSIWSNSTRKSPPSTSATRDNSIARGLAHQSLGSQMAELEGKTGSGSLVDSSVSDDYTGRSIWAMKRDGPSGRSVPATRYGDSTAAQQRGVNHASFCQTHPSETQDSLASCMSRLPTINLNSAVSTQPRQSCGSAFTNGVSSGPSELPPFNVYTKFDRPTDPNLRKQDSAFGSWADSATTPSPTDERRPAISNHFSRSNSMPHSREECLPSSWHEEEPPCFRYPDYSQPSPRPTPNNSRAPSLASVRSGLNNGYPNAVTDHMTAQFGQARINYDSRPSTSYKSAHSTNGYSGTSTPSTAWPSSKASAYGAKGRRESSRDVEHAQMNHLSLEGSSHSQSGNPWISSYANPLLAERYFEPGNTYEFRPGQKYIEDNATNRKYDAKSFSTPSDWHKFGNDTLSVNPRSPTFTEQQALLDPRLQQLMATQLRNQYAVMYNPYAPPAHFQLDSLPPYMGLLSTNVPSTDASARPRDSPVGDDVQSALMYEFKSNTKTRRYELRDIYDHIAEFSGDQHGSRFIQTKLETANSDEKERVFREIQPNAIPLMTDVFGNYVIQKFFEHGDQTHKRILANKMRGQVLQLSLQMYGCRVVQKALDHVLVDQQAMLVQELENYVIKCVKDQNGNHVIQKAIERCSPSNIEFIVAAFHGQVQQLSIHPYGCRVIQRCLEKCDLPGRSMIMAELMDGIHTMITDQFGNYVVQHIVAHDNGEPKQRVLAIVMHALEGYSKHKFASNVVEKCLQCSNDAWRREVVYTLAHSNQRRIQGEGILVEMIKDSFGNYVIQKLLDTLCREDYFRFLDMLHPAMGVAKRTGSGKQTVSIEKKMDRFKSFRNDSIANGAAFHHRPSFQLALPTPPFVSTHNSASNTPPPLTADTRSLQSSGLPSVNGDAVEGATISRKGSEQTSGSDFSHH